MFTVPSLALSRIAVGVACLLTLTLPALADLTMGGNARAVAMGGAGLASGDAPEATALNPAFLANTGLRFAVQMPSVDARVSGADYGDVFDLIGKTTINPEDALNLAVTLGDGPTQLDAATNVGVLLPKADVRVEAILQTRIEPNAAFTEWVDEGADLDEVILYPGMQTDLYARGIATLPSVAMGLHLPVSRDTVGKIAVGVRVKPVTAYYSHYVIDEDAVVANTPLLAPEMHGNKYLKRSSISADLGVLYSPARYPKIRTALVVSNIIEPKALHLPGLDEEQLAPRTISVGAAMVEDSYTLAADLVDLTTEYHASPQFRAGGELRLPGKILALRGGYNSATGFTVGLGLGTFGFAYSNRTPVMLSQTIPF